MTWINEKAATLSHAELLDWNESINKAIAKQLGDEPDTPPIPPIVDGLADYLASFSDGTRPYEGLQTGMDEIDHLIGGLHKFVLLAARAGAGKSTLAVQLALGVIATEQCPVLFYSFEMERRDVLTMLMQNLRRGHAYKLTRNEIILHGAKPISTDSADAIHESGEALQEIGHNFYVVDSTDGPPSLDRMTVDIERLKQTHNTDKVLVVVDSLQDVINIGNAGSTAAEAEVAQRVVEIQQATNATFLCISQKAKGSNPQDPYSGVLGSVSLIHKPTSVLEMLGVHDLIRNIKDADATRTYLKLADQSDIPRPVICRVLKGRFNGSGHVSLAHYGRHGYLEVGRIKDYDTGESSLYGLNSFTN